ncbi:MAG: hypothetical protein V4598_07340 [Bdellovibrionota bacterium]
MKYALPIIAVLLVSCGEIKGMKGSGIGQMRELSQLQISTSDSLTFDSICASLTKKSQKLTAALPNSLNFDVQEKDCDGKTVTFASQQVRVENGGSGGYQYRRTDTSSLFIFPNVETQDSGFMQAICSGSATTMPVLKSADEAVWISAAGVNSTDCPGAVGETCVLVESGSREGTTNNFRIHSREFVRFNLQATSGKYGYFTHRKAYTANNCDSGKNTESIATMR